MRHFELANQEVKNKLLFGSALTPFLTLKRPSCFFVFLSSILALTRRTERREQKKANAQ
jgi:hypothetical protein